MKQNWEQAYPGNAWKCLSKQSWDIYIYKYKHCPCRNPLTCGSKGVQVSLTHRPNVTEGTDKHKHKVNFSVHLLFYVLHEG